MFLLAFAHGCNGLAHFCALRVIGLAVALDEEDAFFDDFSTLYFAALYIVNGLVLAYRGNRPFAPVGVVFVGLNGSIRYIHINYSFGVEKISVRYFLPILVIDNRQEKRVILYLGQNIL